MNDQETSKHPDPKPQAAKKTTSNIPSVRLEELVGDGRELHIVHGEEVYRLIVTRNNKLILQK